MDKNKNKKSFSPIVCAINDNSYRFLTIWWLPDDCLTTVSQPHEDCLRTAWGIPEECLRNAWWLPDHCPTTAWQLPDNCLTTSWWLPDNSMTTTWRVPDDCHTTMIEKSIFSSCLRKSHTRQPVFVQIPRIFIQLTYKIVWS